jgi:succinoglycan biosynthesis protein ExoO
VIANYNGARHLSGAVRSALSQTLSDLEVIIIDDASTDASLELADQLARGDSRVRVIALASNGGPAAARNAGFEQAAGRWLAVLDSDDLMHPRRLERLVAEAERERADIIADDLLVFHDSGDQAPRRHLRGRLAKSSSWIDAGAYVESNAIYANRVCLGYLKPIFLRRAVQDAKIRYDESLTIGEDSDFVARCLEAGLRFLVSPFPYYLYRRHQASLSRVLSIAHTQALLDASLRQLAAADARVRPSYKRYCASLATALAFGHAVDAIKARRFADAFRSVVHWPSTLPLFGMPVAARIGRLARALRKVRQAERPDPRAICVLSRQRLVGATNGSSAYLIALCRGLRSAGFKPHLLQPSPVVFGRWPVLALRPEMQVFETVRLRGAIRLGRFLVCTDPRVLIAAGRYVISRTLQRAKLPYAFVGAAPAPYGIAAPWRPEDLVFVARHTPPIANALITDYAFQNEASVYALRSPPTFVVMHDLFHSRAGQFETLDAADSVATVTADQEMALLDLADVVVAIQENEAAAVRARLPHKPVLVVPMGVDPAASAQPGSGSELLFVGSNTAANVVGLRWFFDEVWPRIRMSAPWATLTVVGNVARAFIDAPDGVEFAGVLADLNAVYARAAVVISPLTAGSGLKIKLVDALAHGKAVVATPITLQGVEEIAGGVVAQAATPGKFAAAVVALLNDENQRGRLGEAGLALVRREFGLEAVCAPLVDVLNEATPQP